MGLGLHPTVEFPGVCDIWFVEISNINPRNVIKNSSADHLLQETCYYTNVVQGGLTKKSRAQTAVEAR